MTARQLLAASLNVEARELYVRFLGGVSYEWENHQ